MAFQPWIAGGHSKIPDWYPELQCCHGFPAMDSRTCTPIPHLGHLLQCCHGFPAMDSVLVAFIAADCSSRCNVAMAFQPWIVCCRHYIRSLVGALQCCHGFPAMDSHPNPLLYVHPFSLQCCHGFPAMDRIKNAKEVIEFWELQCCHGFPAMDRRSWRGHVW